ncbi:MAG: hypothetical protein EON93_06365 [Burkholderiales bacterium]|nr:MAG: hypothetical protein EON93_06365 [Burkholderiales bacterium]
MQIAPPPGQAPLALDHGAIRATTADTELLVLAAVIAAKAVFSPGFNYSESSVMTFDLQDALVR